MKKLANLIINTTAFIAGSIIGIGLAIAKVLRKK